jgi:hypothetical protein
MFRRLVFENSAALFTIVAFITAASIYVTFAWRALRMKRPQIAHFENLPFQIDTPEAPTGRNNIAQGNALGADLPQKTGALKGRNIGHVAPLQGSSSISGGSQGVALGYHRFAPSGRQTVRVERQ